MNCKWRSVFVMCWFTSDSAPTHYSPSRELWEPFVKWPQPLPFMALFHKPRSHSQWTHGFQGWELLFDFDPTRQWAVLHISLSQIQNWGLRDASQLLSSLPNLNFPQFQGRGLCLRSCWRSILGSGPSWKVWIRLFPGLGRPLWSCTSVELCASTGRVLAVKASFALRDFSELMGGYGQSSSLPEPWLGRELAGRSPPDSPASTAQ